MYVIACVCVGDIRRVTLYVNLAFVFFTKSFNVEADEQRRNVTRYPAKPSGRQCQRLIIIPATFLVDNIGTNDSNRSANTTQNSPVKNCSIQICWFARDEDQLPGFFGLNHEDDDKQQNNQTLKQYSLFE